jgi:adenine-specific DNA-methyltransferase
MEFRELMGEIAFDYPKPSKLVEGLLALVPVTEQPTIVLDFFAGSGTTAQAVFQRSAADGANRQFILVQLDEPLGDKSLPDGLESIAEVARERIRRAGSRIKESTNSLVPDLDTGFRTLKVDTTNMADVLRTPDGAEQTRMELDVESVKPDRSGEDLLFQVLLDWGLELTLPISVEHFDEHEVLVVDDGALIACFEKQVSLDLVRAIAQREPLRAVFLDAGFGSDDARINAEQIFREVSPSTDVKTI